MGLSFVLYYCDNIYGVLPAHGSNGSVLVDPFRSDLQIYTTDETIALTSEARANDTIGASEFALEYGFVARNNGSSHARGIGANGCSGAGCNQAQVALSMRIPVSADVSSGRRFTMTFIVVENSQRHVVQSLEEATNGTDAAARASSLGAGTEVRAFRNSLLSAANKDFEALIVGSSSDPKAYLRAKATQAQLTLAQGIVDSESQLLKNAQLSNPSFTQINGALPRHPNLNVLSGHPNIQASGYLIEPYFTNLALIGLLEAKGQEQASLDTVKRWITWFLAHMNLSVPACVGNTVECDNIPGSINKFFYIANKTTEENLNSMDSIDSYSSTFLVLLAKYYALSNDSQLIVDNRLELRASVAIV